ncbi:6791_t:CDS:2 [Ambispora leptoticha]|uniref:Elongation of fatty acids protein n=1 Tax=Ambispora leptoticha TaxID=144679 RepID=A0A9N8WI41_9GLOM|nr:6791_t:CDS:2 [Ambispora leptoticha]
MTLNSTNTFSPPVDYFIKLGETIGYLAEPLVNPLENILVSALTTLFPSISQNAKDFLVENESPFSERLPLMNPFHVLLITLFYLSVVFVGKKIMMNKTKFDTKLISTIHNSFLVWLSAYMCYGVLSEAWNQGYGLFGNPEDKSEQGWQMAKYIWLFYVSKIAEFTDTYIMVLKKNNHQITFLHVYHHCSIFIIWWLVTYVAPTGEAYFSAALNSAVHVVMYGYYLSTTLSVPIRFIKRYITLFQMTQFMLMMIQATYDMLLFKVLKPDAKQKYPFVLTALLWVYMWTMLGLFANFFIADRKREREAKAALKKKSR